MAEVDLFGDLLSSHSVFVSPLNGTGDNDSEQQTIDEDAGSNIGFICQPLSDPQWRWAWSSHPDRYNGNQEKDGTRWNEDLSLAGMVSTQDDVEASQAPSKEYQDHNSSRHDVDGDDGGDGVDQSWKEGDGDDPIGGEGDRNDNGKRLHVSTPSQQEVDLEDQPVCGTSNKKLSLDELIEQGERQMKEAQQRISSTKAPAGPRTASARSASSASQPPHPQGVEGKDLGRKSLSPPVKKSTNGGHASGGGDKDGSHPFSDPGPEQGGVDEMGDNELAHNLSFATTCSGVAEVGQLSMGVPPAFGRDSSTQKAEDLATDEFRQLELTLLREEEEERQQRQSHMGFDAGGSGSAKALGAGKNDRHLAWQADAAQEHGPGEGRYDTPQTRKASGQGGVGSPGDRDIRHGHFEALQSMGHVEERGGAGPVAGAEKGRWPQGRWKEPVDHPHDRGDPEGKSGDTG
ncbi:unnamed protein product, partial [Discosporangium mesarthrocarpum]